MTVILLLLLAFNIDGKNKIFRGKPSMVFCQSLFILASIIFTYLLYNFYTRVFQKEDFNEFNEFILIVEMMSGLLVIVISGIYITAKLEEADKIWKERQN